LNNQARREAERLVEVDKKHLKQLRRARGVMVGKKIIKNKLNSALVQA
jgi:hypothetical protein